MDGLGTRSAEIAAAVLVATTVGAMWSPLPRWEVTCTARLNHAPDAIATALYPVMQLGTAATPVVAGLALATRSESRTAVATVVGGLGAWFGAKAVKRVVRRDRPSRFVTGITVRDGDGTGLGFPSGHAAVAASLAVTAAAATPRTLRPLLAVAAGTVGVARIVVGAHLPTDVAGGWSLGTLTGLAGNGIATRCIS